MRKTNKALAWVTTFGLTLGIAGCSPLDKSDDHIRVDVGYAIGQLFGTSDPLERRNELERENAIRRNYLHNEAVREYQDNQ